MPRFIKHVFTILTICLCHSFLFSQKNITDSLIQILKTSKEDSFKVKLLNRLFEAFEYEDVVKSKAFLIEARNLSKKINYKFGVAESYKNEGYLAEDTGNYIDAYVCYQKALEIHTENKNKSGMASAYHGIGILQSAEGNYTGAINNYLKALQIDLELKDKSSLALDYNSIANAYSHLGNYATSLTYHLKALKLREEIGDKSGVASSLIGLGTLYSNLDDHKKSLSYYFEALNYYKTINDVGGMSTAFINIGGNYLNLRNYPLAIENTLEAVKLEEELGDKRGLSICYNNLAEINTLQGNYPEALKFAHQSLELKQEVNDKEGIIYSYHSLGLINVAIKNHPEARKYMNLALALSKEVGQKERLKSTYFALSQLDSISSDFKSAYENYKMYVSYSDSLYSEEMQRKTFQTQITYDFEKKEAVAQAKHSSEMEKQNAIADEKSRKQLIIIVAVIFVLILVSVFAFFVLRSLKVMAKQKELIQVHQTEIIDSITYAKRLQDAILPSIEELKSNFQESFVLYKPKSIVAGDFYWAEKTDDYHFIAAADCTGHGVPGAMVSIICSNALDRAVNEFGITETGLILDKVRDLVLSAFKKSNEDVKDGMDISLCRIHKAKNEVQWSGANNPLWYFQENELHEIKPDKQPIGKYDHQTPFTTHSFSLKPGTNLYMFSDGYADQFGAGNKKMTRKRFKEIVISVQDKPMNEQYRILDDYFMSWKKNAEQIDDVCIVGIRL